LSDHIQRVAKSQRLLDESSGLQVHLGAPGSASGKTGSTYDKLGSASDKPVYTLNHCRAGWAKQHLLWERAGALGNHSYYLSFNDF
jgi:hypothetical protein